MQLELFVVIKNRMQFLHTMNFIFKVIYM